MESEAKTQTLTSFFAAVNAETHSTARRAETIREECTRTLSTTCDDRGEWTPEDQANKSIKRMYGDAAHPLIIRGLDIVRGGIATVDEVVEGVRNNCETSEIASSVASVIKYGVNYKR